MNARLWHAAVHVSDLDASVAFYEKALGLHEIRRDHPDPTLSISRMGDATEHKVSFACIGLDSYVGIIEDTAKDGGVYRHIANGGEVAYLVLDVYDARTNV